MGDDSWTTSKVVSRSGKCTGKYANEWNMENQGGEKDIIDFNGNIEWREITDEHSNPLSAEDTGISDIADIAETRENPETEIVETFHVETLQDTLDAKYKELESWKKNDVYEEVDDEGQHCVSVRWVLIPKMIEGKLQTKARLCARGFEEILTFRTDSPTCMRESVRIVVIIIVSHMWILHSIDYKTAFLQGKQIDRVLYLRPPCESKTTKIWKLKKTVYGLADAPRVWFLRLKEELLKLGAKVSSYDQGIFFWHSTNGLEGIIICFVDDQLWGGSKWFEENVIEKLRQIFNIGCENSSAFKYIGIDLVQKSDFSVSVNQESYIKSIEPISLERSRQLQKDEVVTEKEKSKLRSLVGQLNWITGISRPDIGFGVCQLSSTIKNATVSHLVKANKILRNVKNSPNSIGFSKLSDLKNLKVVVYTDASFANLPNGGSQGGQIVFLVDKNNNSCPLAWKSNRIKRVVKSTLAAETLSFVEGCDMGIFMSKIVSEIITGANSSSLPVTCMTDNKSLYDAAHTTRIISDTRLRVEMSIVREMIEKKEITLSWIKSTDQVADVLTKEGSSSSPILKILEDAHL